MKFIEKLSFCSKFPFSVESHIYFSFQELIFYHKKNNWFFVCCIYLVLHSKLLNDTLVWILFKKIYWFHFVYYDARTLNTISFSFLFVFPNFISKTKSCVSREKLKRELKATVVQKYIYVTHSSLLQLIYKTIIYSAQ